MDELEKLLAERARLMTEWEGLLKRSEAGDWTKEESERDERLRSEVPALDAKIAAERKRIEDEDKKTKETFRTRAQKSAEEFRKAFSAPSGQTMQPPGALNHYQDELKAIRERSQALRGWCKGYMKATNDERSAMQRLGVDMDAPLDITPPSGDEIRARAIQQENGLRTRAAQTVTTSGGGYLIAQGFMPELEKKLAFYNNFREVVRILQTDQGNNIPWPTVDDTSNTASDRSINTATSETALTFGSVTLAAYGKSTEVLVPYELAEDTAINLEMELPDLLGERHGRKEAYDLTLGSGSSAPQGIITGATTGKTTASATAIAADEILDLEAAMDPAYRVGAVMMMHASIWTYVRKLKDSYGRYLVGDLGNGAPPSLLGYPVMFNNNMASTVATGNKTILFWNPKKFIFRTVRQRELIRDTSRFVREDQILFKIRQRYDSRLIQATSAQLLVQA